MSSIAIPFLLRFHSRTARSTRHLADLALSDVDDTISTASSFETTSHTYRIKSHNFYQHIKGCTAFDIGSKPNQTMLKGKVAIFVSFKKVGQGHSQFQSKSVLQIHVLQIQAKV